VVVNYITRLLARVFGAVASEPCRPEGSCREPTMPKRFPQLNEKEKEKKRTRRTLNMKSRTAVSVVFVLIAATAFAADAAVAQSDAQKSFTTMKSLAGEWEGPVTVPEMPEMS